MWWATSARELNMPARTFCSYAVRYFLVSRPLSSRGGRMTVQSRSLSRRMSSISREVVRHHAYRHVGQPPWIPYHRRDLVARGDRLAQKLVADTTRRRHDREP